MKHPHRLAAEMCHSPKLAARASGLTVDQCRAIRDLRDARYTARHPVRDPLVDAKVTRPWRTATARRLADAESAAREAAFTAELRRSIEAQDRAEATRRSLILAARAARALGFTVRASKSRAGYISSYYCRRGETTLRISDHDIPETPQREFMAREHGRDYYDGYHGRQLIVDEPRRYEWLRRAIILAANGRM